MVAAFPMLTARVAGKTKSNHSDSNCSHHQTVTGSLPRRVQLHPAEVTADTPLLALWYLNKREKPDAVCGLWLRRQPYGLAGI